MSSLKRSSAFLPAFASGSLLSVVEAVASAGFDSSTLGGSGLTGSGAGVGDGVGVPISWRGGICGANDVIGIVPGGTLNHFARDHGEYVLTNPDMLHRSLLPSHARWSRFLRSLEFVVIDVLTVATVTGTSWSLTVALSDGAQSLYPEGFRDLMAALAPVVQAVGRELA